MTIKRQPVVSDDALTAEAVGSLESTVGTFAVRLQRRLQEQAAEQSKSQKLTDERHSRMLQAMTTIRKALSETGKINLGKRFQFKVKVTDWEGWPRVELALVDNLITDRNSHALIVSANDRNNAGTILMSTNADLVLGRTQLAQPGELEKLPKILKKAVRDFLDTVSAYVLNPRNPAEELKAIELPHEEAASDEIAAKLEGANLFTEETDYGNDNQVEDAGEMKPVEI